MDFINLVVTCTKRKRRAVPRRLQLRSVPRLPSAAARAARWLERLQHSAEPLTPAADLYAGDHWQLVRVMAAQRLVDGARTRVWVCSAGYGLISLESRLLPYSATFAGGQPDSVGAGRTGKGSEALPLWWQTIALWRGPTPEGPRTLTQVAEQFPREPLFLVMSENYLRALGPDVSEAVGQLVRPELLSILSAGAGENDFWSRHLLPCEGLPRIGGWVDVFVECSPRRQGAEGGGRV